MADLSIVLELVTASVEAGVAKVNTAIDKMTADTKTKVNEAGKAFNEFSEQIEKTKKSLESVGGALAGIGLAEFIHSAMDAGAMASEMASKFGISTQAMLELQVAASTAGIGADKLATAMNKMMMGAQEAVDGNLKLRAAFQAVGVSMDYMRTHSPDQVMAKITTELANMKDKALAAQTANELFGRGFRIADLDKFQETLKKTTGTRADDAAAADSAHDVMEKLNAIVVEAQIDFLNLIKPLMDLIGTFTDLTTAGEALLAIVVGFAALASVTLLVKAFAMAWEGLRLVMLGVNAAVATLNLLLTPEFAIIAAITAAVLALGAAYEYVFGGAKTLGESFTKLWDDVSEKVGIVVDKMKDMVGLKDKLEKKPGDQPPPPGSPTTTGNALDPGAVALQNAKNTYEMMVKQNEQALLRVQKETELVGQSDEYRKGQMAAFDAQSKYEIESLRINQQIKTLQVEQANTRGKDNSKIIGELRNELVELENQRDSMTKANSELGKREMLNKLNVEVMKQQSDLAKQLKDLELEYREIGMDADEKRLANIEKIYNAQVKTLEDSMAKSGFGTQWRDDAEAVAIYEEKLKSLKTSTAALTAETQKIIDKNRDFTTGWQSAMKQYVSDATNGAKAADTLFKDFTTGIEDAFVNFAQTGKFSFKSMIDQMITDFIRFETRLMMSQAFKAFSGGGSDSGSFLGMIGGLFSGKAAGGFIGAGQPTLVGENGPEIFTPPTGGQVTPNGGAGYTPSAGGDTYHTHNYNIQAVDAKSVAQLFAENRMTMFGMVEQARRELPMRTR